MADFHHDMFSILSIVIIRYFWPSEVSRVQINSSDFTRAGKSPSIIVSPLISTLRCFDVQFTLHSRPVVSLVIGMFNTTSPSVCVHTYLSVVPPLPSGGGPSSFFSSFSSSFPSSVSAGAYDTAGAGFSISIASSSVTSITLGVSAALAFSSSALRYSSAYFLI